MIQEEYNLVEITSDSFQKTLLNGIGDLGKEIVYHKFNVLKSSNPKKHYRINRILIITDIVKDNKFPEKQSKFLL